MRSSDRRAIALSNMDIPDGPALLVHSCEDCACPVSSERAEKVLPELSAGRLVRAAGVLELELDADHVVLFSPAGSGGVVVVNRAGCDIAARLGEPTKAADLVAAGFAEEDVAGVVRKLQAYDIVHPIGMRPQPVFAPSVELTAWLHVTNKCNLKCPYCYVHKSEDAMPIGVARESVDALVRSAVRNGFRALRLKYAGGEASLNAGVLVELHDYAQSACDRAGLRLSAVLLSNGVAISDALARHLTARDIAVMISLDGIGAPHDAQRPTIAGKNSSARVVRTVDRLREHGLAPHISITITSRNTNAVAQVVRFAIERDLTFSFNFFRDNDCAAGFANLQYKEQAMLDGLTGAFAVIEELLPRWSVLGSVLDRGQLLTPRRRSCGVGDDYVVIDQNGRLAKCHMEIADVIGDIRTVDPVSAIRDDSVGVRNLLVDDKAGCRDCTWRNWCAGGCTAATFRATGRFDVRSPNCNIYQTIYPHAIRLEGLRVLKYAKRVGV